MQAEEGDRVSDRLLLYHNGVLHLMPEGDPPTAENINAVLAGFGQPAFDDLDTVEVFRVPMESVPIIWAKRPTNEEILEGRVCECGHSAERHDTTQQDVACLECGGGCTGFRSSTKDTS